MAKSGKRNIAVEWKKNPAGEQEPPIPTKFKEVTRTAQETAKQEREGQLYIQQREQIAMDQGISSKNASRLLSEQIRANDPEIQARLQLEQAQIGEGVKQGILNQQTQDRAKELSGTLGQIDNFSQEQFQQPQVQPQEQTQTQTKPKGTNTGLNKILFGNIFADENGNVIDSQGNIVPMVNNVMPLPIAGVGGAGGVTPITTIPKVIAQAPNIPASKTIMSKILTTKNLVTGFLGLVGLSVTGVTKKILSKQQQITEAKRITANSKSSNALIIRSLNQGLITQQEAVDMYNRNWANIYQQERNLKAWTSTDLDAFLTGGTDELIDISALIQDKQLYDAQIKQAIISPNPQAFYVEDSLNSEEALLEA